MDELDLAEIVARAMAVQRGLSLDSLNEPTRQLCMNQARAAIRALSIRGFIKNDAPSPQPTSEEGN